MADHNTIRRLSLLCGYVPVYPIACYNACKISGGKELVPTPQALRNQAMGHQVTSIYIDEHVHRAEQQKQSCGGQPRSWHPDLGKTLPDQAPPRECDTAQSMQLANGTAKAMRERRTSRVCNTVWYTCN